jgi:hypothetical protein
MKKILSIIISVTLFANILTFVSAATDNDYEWSGNDVDWYFYQAEQVINSDTPAALFSAANTSWYTSSETNFEISTEDEFLGFISLVNGGNDFSDKKITLTSDIQFSQMINPLLSFNGEFDGKSHSLSSVYISANDDTYTALFNALGANANVHDFSLDGTFSANNAAAIAGTNNGKIENVASLASVQGNKTAGGICVTNNGTIKNSSANNSVVLSGSASSSATALGGICANNTGVIEGCENKAAMNTDSSSSGNLAATVGGIAGANSGTIRHSFNYSPISGLNYIGGIVGKNTKDVTDCANTADISSQTSYVGGIAGSNAADSTISQSRNSGDITCDLTGTSTSTGCYAGGIAGTSAGNITACENGGDVLSNGTGAGGITAIGTGNISSSANFGSVTAYGDKSGGIIGQANGGTISECKNYGTTSAHKYSGGIAGETKSSAAIEKCGNSGDILTSGTDDTNFAGGIVGVANGSVQNCLNISQNINSTYNRGSIIGYAGADNLLENSYSIGTLKLIGNNKAAVNSSVVAEGDASLTDGTLLAALNADESVWQSGTSYPVPYAPDLSSHASTLAELTALLANENVSYITLDADIDGDITISRAVTIDGQFHSIGGITQNAAATLKNISADGEIISNAPLTLDGIVLIAADENAGITVSQTLTINGALFFDNSTLAMIAVGENASITGADTLYFSDGNYYFNYPISTADDTTIVVKAANNDGVTYDIYPYISGTNCYFFMPYSADLSSIIYTSISDETEENHTIDLSDGKTATINIMGLDFTAKAYSSGLPVLYLDIDEQYGKISAMNNSPKHTDLCYGDMRLEIPQEMADIKGWDTVYTSVGNDKDKSKPGTMELRGRGNSSWTQAISANGPRPYQLKLEKKLNLMGMGSAKTYTLLKSDQIQSTNKTLLDMSIAMGLKYTPQSEFVDVYLNGDYIGMYTLAEKVQINESRINISDLESEIEDTLANGGTLDDLDLTGGYLIEVDNTNETLQFKVHGNRITIKSPENLDTTVADDSNYAYIKTLMTDLFNAIYGDGYLTEGEYAGKHFTEVLDMDSVTRYFLEQELTSNLDNGLGSTFFYKDKDSIDGKIYMGVVWDNDRCGGTNTTTGWQLPELNGYGPSGTQSDGEDGIFKAMCKHKEFISYVLAYYSDNYKDNNIKSTFASYADTANENGAYINTAAVMSRLRWNHKYAFDPNKLGTFITKRAAWVDENIDTIKTYATKGEYITDIAEYEASLAPTETVAPSESPIETAAPTETVEPNATTEPTESPIETAAPTATPNPNPITQLNYTNLVAAFRYGNGEAGADLDASLGNKTDGYTATSGAQQDTATLFASVNGENTKTLEWSGNVYNDGDDTYTPAVVSASKKNTWGNSYVDVTLSTAECDTLYFSAKIGATNKGPASYKLQYSLDGENYIDVANATYTLTANKTMEQAFDKVKLPDEICGNSNVHLRIALNGDLAVSGTALADNPNSGEFAVNDVFVFSSLNDEPTADVEWNYWLNDDSIGFTLQNNTEDTLALDFYIAIYDDNDMLLKLFKISPEIIAHGTFSDSVKYTLNGERVKVFCWEHGTMVPYA